MELLAVSSPVIIRGAPIRSRIAVSWSVDAKSLSMAKSKSPYRPLTIVAIETPKALAVARPSVGLSEAELIAFSRENLSRYKCPTSIDFVARSRETQRQSDEKITSSALLAGWLRITVCCELS